MGAIIDTNGFLLCNDGTPLVVEIPWKRDVLLNFAFYDPSTLVAKSLASTTVTATFRERPYSSAMLLQKALTLVSSGTGGLATLAIADTDLSGINWDLGQRLKYIYFDIDVLSGTNHYAARDGVGAATFAAAILQSIYGVP